MKLVNRANWDSRVAIHYDSEEYGVAKFIADPDHISGVVDFDREIVGDVSGKRLIHLQCHIGTDTIGWARLVVATMAATAVAAMTRAALNIRPPPGPKPARSPRNPSLS